MSDETRLYYLRIALIVFGLIFVPDPLLAVGLVMGNGSFALSEDDPRHLCDAWRLPADCVARSARQSQPWSSIVHGAIMSVQAIRDPAEVGHLLGDVPALFLIAIVLAALMPRAAPAHA